MLRRWPYLTAAAVVLVGFAVAPSVWRLGETKEGRRLLSTGQTIPLDPKAIALPARGLDMALSPDGAFAYAKTTRGVSKVDLTSGQTVAEGRIASGASMCGIDVTPDFVAVTDAQRTLFLLDPATLEVKSKIDLGTAKVGGPCYPCGVKVVGKTAYVALNRGNTVAIVDLGKATSRTVDVGLAPYGIQVDGDRLLVSCWGRPAVEGKPHAPSAGVELETKERGEVSGGTLVELNTDGSPVRTWQVGPQPTEILTDGDKVYVACANADSIICATPDGKVKETHIEGLPGAAPSSMTRDGDRLWIALSGENRVMALDLNSGKSVGSIETGWYPVAIRRGPNGLVVTDAKGEGGPVRNVRSLVGNVRQIDPATLKPTPKPAVSKGRKLPVKHAIYIIKENRTYDQLFGDLPQGKGDPSLVMYGREVTPNHHALAEEFVLLDNFADNGSVSTDGHAWAIEGQATTFYERSFGGWTRAYPFGGDEPVAVSNGGHLWDAALAAGKTFRNFGEFVYANNAPGFVANYTTWQEGKTIPWKAAVGVERVKAYTCPDYPGWNLAIPDGYRADVFLKEFQKMETDGKMPDLMTLYLPQDHTSGDSPDTATPKAHVADNDLAIGRIVDAISHSQFWKDTAIFILEDDPQDGLDSVDGHRSICLVASPYTRRGIVSSTFYDQTSVLRTICDIIGAKPYTRFIAASTPMFDLFGKTADLTPYTARPANIPLDQLNPPKKNAAKLDLSGPDATDEEVMDRVLWNMAYPNRPYPHDEKKDDDDER